MIKIYSGYNLNSYSLIGFLNKSLEENLMFSFINQLNKISDNFLLFNENFVSHI